MINREEKYEKLLLELLEEIGGYTTLQPKKDSEPENCLTKSVHQTEKAIYSLQNTLDEMRICVKYLLFDLDATRRETLYFKKLLDDKD